MAAAVATIDQTQPAYMYTILRLIYGHWYCQCCIGHVCTSTARALCVLKSHRQCQHMFATESTREKPNKQPVRNFLTTIITAFIRALYRFAFELLLPFSHAHPRCQWTSTLSGRYGDCSCCGYCYILFSAECNYFGSCHFEQRQQK